MTHEMETLDQVIPPLVRRILVGRGMDDDQAIREFLVPNYDRDLADPALLLDMPKAVDRLAEAITRREQVAVYGDYDIDGLTATALLCEALKINGLDPIAYIPDRFEEGYGINQQALAKLQGQGVQLVISVDCGITSYAEAQWARENGLDLIITDHHAVPDQIPPAIAVINPKRPGDPYPGKDLAGVGVAFKLVQALARQTGLPAPGQEKWLLDLVAFGTVCDVVSLTGENRALVHFGLKVLAKSRRIGLGALAEVAGFQLAEVRAQHLGFRLGPRMNAAGRLEHAARSLELLQTGDSERCAEIAQELDELNTQRRVDQEGIVVGALAQAETYPDDAVLVLADSAWSHGIVGIAASKVAEQLMKPVLVAQVMGEFTKGSARSVVGFDIIAALRARPELFLKYGGHAFAAGFTLPTKRLDDLRTHLNEYWKDHEPVEQTNTFASEVTVTSLDQLDWDVMSALEMLEPFGNGNPEPIIELAEMNVSQVSRMGNMGKHVRLIFRDSSGGRLAAVGFGWGERIDRLLKRPVRYTGILNKNTYQGTTSLQFQIKDVIHE